MLKKKTIVALTIFNNSSDEERKKIRKGKDENVV
jgi:hypothetical protein